MAKRNFQFKLVSYMDTVATNNPESIIIDVTEKFTDDLGAEHAFKILTIDEDSSDVAISFGFADAKVLFLKNLSDTLPIVYKINGTGNTPYTIAPGKVLFLESANAAGTGLIQSLHLTNSHAQTPVNVKVFVSK